jgi:putative lipoic acid-binding regulatory protein
MAEKVDNTKELKLDYPINWKYKIITAKEHNAKNIAKEILHEREHNIKKSQNSSGGKYASHSLEVLVHNDDDRKALFEALKKHKHIKFVL